MNTAVMVLNAGSSSIKFAIYLLPELGGSSFPACRGQVAGIGRGAEFDAFRCDAAEVQRKPHSVDASDHAQALQLILSWTREQASDFELVAVGHRVVHGGRDRHDAVRVDDDVMRELKALCRLAPHHQPHNLAAIETLAQLAPALPQVACFDTAFHALQDPVVKRLPLPASFAERGVQRYGFHGLSCEYIVSALRRRKQGLPSRLLIAHLGNGGSLCAVRDGRSIATTMGFSTLDGLMMGTRCGALDPGVLLHLMHEDQMDEAALSDLLYNHSGLAGVSGISADMRTLLASDAPSAREAVDLYVHRLLRELGAMLMLLEGADLIVFTGGIGEHAAPIRERVCRGLAWLGVRLDSAANSVNHPVISSHDSAIAVEVMLANEERAIADHTIRILRLAA